MKKIPSRYYLEESREAFIADALMIAGIFSCSLLVLALILIRSGLLPVIF